MKQIFAYLFSFLLVYQVAHCAMSEKQMIAARKLVRNTCQNKAKPTSDQVDGLQKGDFIQDKNLQCYIYCVLNTYKLMRKDNSFDWENGIAALVANAPASVAGPGSKSIENCKDAIKTTDNKCMAAYEIAKCVYDDNPSNYFLP